MIPLKLQSEPSSFDENVRKKGNLFLAKTPNPSVNQWKNKEYWQVALADMRKSYGCICAYSANWIPHSTGNHSIDHFIPKSKRPDLAYEWGNFRYVSARFNSRKGSREIVDPFTLKNNAFTLNFKSFFIFPNTGFSIEEQAKLGETIEWLRLNLDDDLVEERKTWFYAFLEGHISFEHLKKHAPFIAYEAERQKIINTT